MLGSIDRRGGADKWLDLQLSRRQTNDSNGSNVAPSKRVGDGGRASALINAGRFSPHRPIRCDSFFIYLFFSPPAYKPLCAQPELPSLWPPPPATQRCRPCHDSGGAGVGGWGTQPHVSRAVAASAPTDCAPVVVVVGLGGGGGGCRVRLARSTAPSQ